MSSRGDDAECKRTEVWTVTGEVHRDGAESQGAFGAFRRIVVLHGSVLRDRKEMESLPGPSIVGSTRVGGIDFNRTRIWRVARSLLALAALPRGFSVSELVRHVH